MPSQTRTALPTSAKVAIALSLVLLFSPALLMVGALALFVWLTFIAKLLGIG